MYNVTLRRIQEAIAMEINKYYAFLSVCLRARGCVCVSLWVRACGLINVA
jgi:hypothetical protein